MKTNCAIVVAGGKGTRMGKEINKLFLKLKDKPILAHTLEKFEKNKLIDTIILVAAREEVEYCKKEIIEKYSLKKVMKIVSGGNDRRESVLNGLKAVEHADIVLIHDGARPFVDYKIIADGIRYAKLYGASACGVEPKDTIKLIDKSGFSKETLNRSDLFCVQTPQCFKMELILAAHEYVKDKDLVITDDTSVVEKYGEKVFLYKGNYNNIKITTPEDLIIGENILQNEID